MLRMTVAQELYIKLQDLVCLFVTVCPLCVFTVCLCCMCTLYVRVYHSVSSILIFLIVFGLLLASLFDIHFSDLFLFLFSFAMSVFGFLLVVFLHTVVFLFLTLCCRLFVVGIIPFVPVFSYLFSLFSFFFASLCFTG